MSSTLRAVMILATALLVGAVVFAVVYATGRDDDRERRIDTTSDDGDFTPAPEPEPEVELYPAIISLDRSSCEDEWPVVLQPQDDGTVKLVAEARVVNDGDLPGRATVKATWFYFGGGTETASTKVRVRPGRTVRVPLSKVVSQSDGLRMVGHQHGDRMCRVTVR